MRALFKTNEPSPSASLADSGVNGNQDESSTVRANIVGAPRQVNTYETLEVQKEPTEEGFQTFHDTRFSVSYDVETLPPSTRLQAFRRYFMTYVNRLHALRIDTMKLLHWEHQSLCKTEKIFVPCAQVLCWRRTALEVATFFQFCSFFFAGSRYIRAATGDYEDFGKGKVFGMQLGEYAAFFKKYMFIEYLYKLCIVGAQGIAFTSALLAACRWRRFPYSAKFAGIAYAIAYFMPFAMLLSLPFSSSIDIRGIQKQYCREIVDGAGSNSNVSIAGWGPQKLLKTVRNTKLLGIGATSAPTLGLNSIMGLRFILQDQYGTMLPEDFCESEPEDWTVIVEEMLAGTGRLIEDGQSTCSAANNTGIASIAAATSGASQMPDLTQDLTAAIAACEGSTCAACGSSTCLTLLPTLQAGAALTLSSARAQASWDLSSSNPQTSQEALAAMGLQDASSPVSSCAGCLNELDGARAAATTGQVPSCASICMPLWAGGIASYSGAGALTLDVLTRLNASFTNALSAASFAAQAANAAELSRLCLRAEDLDLLKLLLSFATATRPWRVLFGVRLAARALSVLLPCNYAMMLGSFKGACIAKTVVPYSRVPGLILICAVVFTLPHLLTLLVALKSIMGDWRITALVVCFLGSNLVFLPWGYIFGGKSWWGNGMLDPANHKNASSAMKKRQQVAKFFQIGMLVFLCLFVFMSDNLWDLMKLGLVDIDFNQIRAHISSPKFLKFVGWTVVDLFCAFYGMTRIAGVFFVDMCLGAVLIVDEADADPGDEEFRKEHGAKEKTLLVKLHEALQPSRRQVAENGDESAGDQGCCSALWAKREVHSQQKTIDTE